MSTTPGEALAYSAPASRPLALVLPDDWRTVVVAALPLFSTPAAARIAVLMPAPRSAQTSSSATSRVRRGGRSCGGAGGGGSPPPRSGGRRSSDQSDGR